MGWVEDLFDGDLYDREYAAEATMDSSRIAVIGKKA